VSRHNRRGNQEAAFQTPLGLGAGRGRWPLSVVAPDQKSEGDESHAR
jgi:hypothetical protein